MGSNGTSPSSRGLLQTHARLRGPLPIRLRQLIVDARINVALQKEIRNLEDKLSRDGAVMSEKDSSKLERDILAKRREMKRSQDEFRDDLNIRKNEVLSKLQRQMYEATVTLAKEQKFDIILGQGVVYSNDSVDITDEVLEKLKAEFK